MNKHLFSFIFLLVLSEPLCSQTILVPYCSKGLWGYADTAGKIRIKPFLDSTTKPFYSSSYVVLTDKSKKCGVIDTQGNKVVPFVYDRIRFESSYFISARNFVDQSLHDKYDIYTFRGKKVFPFSFRKYYFTSYNTSMILIEYNDSIVMYRVNWKTAEIKNYGKKVGASFMTFVRAGSRFDYSANAFVLKTRKDGRNVLDTFLIPGVNEWQNGGFKKYEKPSTEEMEKAVYESDYARGGMGSTGRGSGSGSGDIISDGNGDDFKSRLYWNIVKKNGKYGLRRSVKDTMDIWFEGLKPTELGYPYYYYKQNGKWGLLKENGEKITEPECDELKHSSKQYVGYRAMHQNRQVKIPVCWTCKNNGRYSLYRLDSLIYKSDFYDSIIPLSTIYFLVKKDSLWGLMNSKTGVVHEPVIDLLSIVPNGPVFIENRQDVCVVSKLGTSYRLYASVPFQVNDTFSNVEEKESIFILEKNNLYGLYFYSNRQFSYIPCRYNKPLSLGALILGEKKYYLLKRPDGSYGYVREDGKEFFD